MANVILRAGHSYDEDAASLEAGIGPGDDPSLAQQQFRDECDINTIVKRFGLTGELPGDFEMPQSGDFTGITNFQEAMNAVRNAEEMFMLVPADVRSRFANDAGRFVEFFNDASNRDEAMKLGLLQPPPEKTRDVVQAVDELAKVLTPKV